MSVLISGSIALDHVKTQKEEHENLLGGSASFATIAASFFSSVNLVSIVGKDFPAHHLELFKARDVNLDGVQFSDGETFRWSGEYSEDMNTRETHDVALNVLEEWKPVIPESIKKSSRIVLLANDSPDNQHHVLDQLNDGGNSIFTIADTMDLWITIARQRLEELLPRLDLLVLNDSEARLLLEESNLIAYGEKLLAMGPKNVIIKKGEHGALLFGADQKFFSAGATPLRELHDPTGAGDSFVGGMAGYLDALGKEQVSFDDLKAAIARGTIVAAYTCESFSTKRLEALSQDDYQARLDAFRAFTEFS